MQIDVSVAIPATAGKYNSDPYYIGLKKNGELNTTEAISVFEITLPDWVKAVSLGNKSSYGDYYPLTYEVYENTETSPRSGIITVTYGPANKSLAYPITLSANTTLEPTEPTPTVYDFTAKYHVLNQGDGDKYSLKVNNYSVGSESGPFESINAGDQSNSEQLDINITMSNQDDKTLPDLKFMFEISCNDLESFDAVIYNDDVGGEKTVYILHSLSNIGELKIESIRPGLVISITIFRGGLMSIIEQPQLSEGITGTITINSDIIPFIVTFGFI